MPDPKFVEVVGPSGAKQIIPAAWLDHPVLGKDFRLPPSAVAKAAASAAVTNKTRSAGDTKE